ncbi:helix-turn-helix transcriptional regulator [Streptomyces sp. CC224B]|uniref:helix-turn-helix transcriptional regulator n=1 Tax=Streptomyces sp. CC224B TaxID=3044571 RepID=UPI0024A8990E|nr:helix-turn-helix transcriptional regulator [Streptomyces sp. CC224B]
MAALSVDHYERMLDLAVLALREPDPRRLWDPVVTELLKACGGEFLFLRRDGPACAGGAMRFWSADGATGADVEAVRRHLHRACPLAAHYATTGDRIPRTAADVLGDREWGTCRTAELLRTALGADHLLGLPLTDAARPFRAFLICRSGPAFTAAHLAYARRIQPLLAAVDRQAELLERCRRTGTTGAAGATGAEGGGTAGERPPGDSAHGDGARPGDGAPGDGARPGGAHPGDGARPGGDLTPRELTVLGLLGDALTAAVIARRLGISVHTVQKHIQSVYRKLGTRDRVATVLLAQTHGLIPPPAGGPGPGRR